MAGKTSRARSSGWRTLDCVAVARSGRVLVLDLVVRLTPFQAGWKDVDELDWSIKAGVISVATANDIQTAGHRALRSAEALEWPFDEDWNQWLPDDDWPVPQMAPRWREVALSDRP